MRRLRSVDSLPPDPDLPSPPDANRFSVLTDHDTTDVDTDNPPPPRPSTTVGPPFFPPSNQDLSFKLDHLLNLIDTSNQNLSHLKSDVDLLLFHHEKVRSSIPPSTSVLPTIVPTVPIPNIPPATTPSDTKTVHPTGREPLPVHVPMPSTTASKASTIPITSSSTSSPTNFGQNEFSLAITNNTKLKFSVMESSLKDCVLHSDSQRDMKSLYESITQSITFLFN